MSPRPQTPPRDGRGRGAGEPWRRRHRRLAVGGAAALLTVAAVGAGWPLALRGLVRRLLERRGLDAPTVGNTLWHLDSAHEAFVAGALSLLALGGVLVAWRTTRLRWWAALPALLVTWLAVERFAAPHLSIALGLQTLYAVRDPDHRPTSTSRAKGMNADAVRSRHAPQEFAQPGTNIVFLGDSFTYGMRLAPEDAFPQRVEGLLAAAHPRLGVRVANFGWTSSSPYLSWRRLVDLGDRYHPDLVVLCVDMTDFHDEIKWRFMVERRGIYALYDRVPITLLATRKLLPWLYWRLYAWSGADVPLARFFACEQPLEESRPYLGPMRESLEGIDAWCRARGARFIVFVLPRTFQYSDRESPRSWEADQYTVLGPWCEEPFRWFEELVSQVDFPVHSLLDTFRETDVFPTAFEDDPHWNPDGARVAAAAIARVLHEELRAREERGR